MTVDLNAASPRPWKHVAGEVWTAENENICYVAAWDEGNPVIRNDPDAALIGSAVNEYEALRALEEHVRLLTVPVRVCMSRDQARAFLTRLDELRAVSP